MKLLIGAVLVVAGLVLALAFPDATFFWLRGRPFGIVLAILGVLDLVEGLRARSGDARSTR